MIGGRFFAASLAAIGLGVTACDKTPTAPTASSLPPDLQRLELEVAGPGSIGASPWDAAIVVSPGQTIQLRARGYLRDGSSRDVTNEVNWNPPRPSSGNPVWVVNGLVQAPTVGRGQISASYLSNSLSSSLSVLVMPAGTFAISGYVFDAKSSRPVPNARVEMIGAEHADQRATTLENGWYGVLGIPSRAEIRVSRNDDYEPVTDAVALTDNQSRLDFRLVERPSSVRVDGIYTLTVVADDSCSTEFWGTTRARLPEHLKVRTYSAAVSQTANTLTVELTAPTFRHRAGFPGRVQPDLTVLSLRDYYSDWNYYEWGWMSDVEERLEPPSYLAIIGEATISTASFAGTLNGSFLFFETPYSFGPAAACVSSVHQFRLTR